MKKYIPLSISKQFKHEYILDISDNKNYGGFVIIGYPYFEAFVTSTESDFWIRVDITVDLNKKLIVFPYDDTNKKIKKYLFNIEHSQRKEVQQFFETIPSEITALVSNYSDCHWEILKAIKILGEDFISLIKTNPMLAYLVVNLEKLNPSFKVLHEVELLQRLIRTKQKDILRFGLFPATESMRKIFSKIDPKNFSTEKFILFQRFFYKKIDPSNRIFKLLLHIENINSSLLDLITNQQHLCKNLKLNTIRQLIESPNFNSHIKILNEIYLRCKKYKLKYPFIESLDLLDETNEKNKKKARLKAKQLESFPRPPIPGNSIITPLDNVKDLISWSKKQSNCIRHNSKKVKRKQSYFYKVVFQGEEATIEILIQDNSLKMGSLLGVKNVKVSNTLRKVVKDWFLESKKFS